MAAGSPGIPQSKKTLRKACEACRDALPLQARVAGADAIARIGLGFAAVPERAVVSAYAAMGAELDPAALLHRLAGEGFRTALPVITQLGSPLMFRAWQPGDPLVPRRWGILEPDDSSPEVEPDVLLVPLLAFDRRGGRLGYGGGYYDLTLARLRAVKPVVAIGLAFAEQELDAVPLLPHDERLDWVLTPGGPIDTRAKPNA